jgi:hypothetical protein
MSIPDLTLSSKGVGIKRRRGVGLTPECRRREGARKMASLGNGFRLHGISLEAVPNGFWPFDFGSSLGEPVTRGIEARLPWLNHADVRRPQRCEPLNCREATGSTPGGFSSANKIRAYPGMSGYAASARRVELIAELRSDRC